MPKDAKQRVGILGGTFDPIHFGHINPAIACIEQLDLEQLFLMPAHIPPHKSTTVANAEHRKNMATLACDLHENLLVDDRELARNTPSYTALTLAEIKTQHPHWHLHFIVGMDSLLALTTWYQWQDILLLSHIVVTVRPGYDLSEIDSETHSALSPYFAKHAEELLNTPNGRIFFVEQPTVDISSTKIREYMAQNKLLTEYMPTNVIDYIVEHKLYQ